MNKEGIMGDNRKGTWEDVTEECKLRWPIGTKRGKWLELHHGGSARALLGPGAIQSYGGSGEYRIIENPGDTHYTCGTFRIEHFIPDPEPEWVDVTDDCVVETSSNQGGLCARVSHRGNALAFLGTEVSDWTSDRNGYRLIAWPATGGESGGIRIEKRND